MAGRTTEEVHDEEKRFLAEAVDSILPQLSARIRCHWCRVSNGQRRRAEHAAAPGWRKALRQRPVASAQAGGCMASLASAGCGDAGSHCVAAHGQVDWRLGYRRAR